MQRHELERIAGSSALPRRFARQASALLLAADGVATNEIARRLQTTSDTVRAWRRRFESGGVDSVGRIKPGRGRKASLTRGDAAAEVVRLTLEEPPKDGAARWTTRAMARRVGIGKDSVARIWRENGLRPDRGDATASM